MRINEASPLWGYTSYKLHHQTACISYHNGTWLILEYFFNYHLW